MRSEKDLHKVVATEMEKRDPEEVGLSWFGNKLEGKGVKIKCFYLQDIIGPDPSCSVPGLLLPLFLLPSLLATLAFTLTVPLLGTLIPDSPLVHPVTSFRSLLNYL